MPTKPEPAPTDVPRLPPWRRPRGVTSGTWHYVTERTIADHYDAFVADTPLCDSDAHLLAKLFPGTPPDLGSPAETSNNHDSSNVPNASDGQASNTHASQVVLDLGCGTGRAAIPLADRGYDVIAIDLSQRMLKVMMDKVKQLNPRGSIQPLRANLVQLNCVADHSAHHAVCLFSTLGMIQGRENRRSMLRHVRRIVRPGGTLLIHVHNRWAAIGERGGVRSLAISRWNSIRCGPHEFGDSCYAYRGVPDMFMHRFSRRELIRDLRVCGWKVDRVWRLAVDGTFAKRTFEIAGGFIVACRNRQRDQGPEPLIND